MGHIQILDLTNTSFCNPLLKTFYSLGNSSHAWRKIGKNDVESVLYPAFFGGGAGFSTRLAKINCCAAGGSVGECFKLSPVGYRDEGPENCGYFAFLIAQNITPKALQQQTVIKAYTRNQNFWEFGGLSLGSQTGILASK